MDKTSILIALLLQLCTMIQGLVPCSEHYSIITNPGTNEIMGQIKITSPSSKLPPYNLKVGFHTNAAIHRKQPVAEIQVPYQFVQDIEEGKPLLFRIFFPMGQPIPRLTTISFSNQQICPSSGQTENTTTVEIERIIPIEQLPSSTTFRTTTAVFNNGVPLEEIKSQQSTQNNTSDNIDDECGISSYSSNPNRLIVGGETTIPGQWPWLVALFIKNGYEFQCSGSLLTKNHILTAGHCLINSTSLGTIHPNMLKVVLGRFNLHQFHAEGTVNREVASYTIHPNYTDSDNADSDLAILILRTPVEYSQSIKPICLWSGLPSFQNIISKIGYVVGWGKDEFGNRYTEEPRMAKIPIVSQENCLWSHPVFATLTSNRTFCAGDGSIPYNGDSGSGLMLFDANTNRFLLRGVVSRSVLDNEQKYDQTKFVVFVDVAKYLPWIHQQISTITINTSLGKVEPQQSTQNAIVNNNNDECGVSRLIGRNLLISNGEKTNPGQWPWVVALFEVGKDHVFKCGGSLLSNKHVLTAANCVNLHKQNNDTLHPNVLVVVLGPFNLHQWREEGAENREVASFKIHPDYTHMISRDANLAILTLSTPVQFNDFIKPICLWSGRTELYYVVDRIGYVVGWGQDELGNRYTGDPRMTKVAITDQVSCLRNHGIFHHLISDRTFCAGMSGQTGPCYGDSGSGLVLYDASRDQFQLRGIVSRIQTVDDYLCDLKKYVVYVDVAKYLPWIHQQISTTINGIVPPGKPQQTTQNSIDNNECGVGPFVGHNLLITNGEPTNPGQWPWVVALFEVGKDHVFKCGGSLLSNNHVLTAANCVNLHKQNNDTLHPNVLVVVLGRFNLHQWREEGAENREVASFKIHPDYTHTISGDSNLAILTLKTPVEFNEFIKPICLWSGPIALIRIVNRTGYVVGWGQDQYGNRYTEDPRMARVAIVDQERCLLSNWIFISLTSDRTFCAGTHDESSPCNGDIGSGLVFYDASRGRYQLRGVVSRSLFGDGLCDLKKYVVYVDVAKYVPWIQEQISTT